MAQFSVAARCKELDELLEAALGAVSNIRSLDGARNPFSSSAENAKLHEFLKRSQVHADKLTEHFGGQLRRKKAL